MNIKNNSIYKLIYVVPIVLYCQTVFSKVDVDETAVTNAAEQFLVSKGSNGCLINTQNDKHMHNALAWEKPNGKAGIILLNFQQSLGQCRIGFPGQCIDVTFDKVTPPQYDVLCRTEGQNWDYHGQSRKYKVPVGNTGRALPGSEKFIEASKYMKAGDNKVIIRPMFTIYASLNIFPEVISARVLHNGSIYSMDEITLSSLNNHLEEGINHFKSKGFTSNKLRTIGSNGTFLTRDLMLFRSGLPDVRIIDTNSFKVRINNANNLVNIEDLTGVNWGNLHKMLILSLVDPKYKPNKLKRRKFYQHPMIYLAN